MKIPEKNRKKLTLAAQKAPARRDPSYRKKERVLVEFPTNLLKRADEAARKLGKNRSELIRTAVERRLDEIDSNRFENELAGAYAANAAMGRSLCEEFASVDQEGFE